MNKKYFPQLSTTILLCVCTNLAFAKTQVSIAHTMDVPAHTVNYAAIHTMADPTAISDFAHDHLNTATTDLTFTTPNHENGMAFDEKQPAYFSFMFEKRQPDTTRLSVAEYTYDEDKDEFENDNNWDAWVEYNRETKSFEPNVAKIDEFPDIYGLSLTHDLIANLHVNSLLDEFTGTKNRENTNAQMMPWSIHDSFEIFAILFFAALILCIARSASREIIYHLKLDTQKHRLASRKYW
jgi:hypothetical protein